MSGNATSLDDGVAQRRQLDTLGDCDPFDVFGWDHTMAPQGRPAIQDRYTTLIRITQVHNRGDPQLPSLLALNRARDAFLESWENVVRRTRGRNSNTWNPDAPMDFRALRRPRPSRPATHPTTPTRNRPPPSHYAPLQASTSRSAPTFRVNTGTGGWSSRRSQSPETSHFATRTPRSARVRSPSGHISAGDSDDDVIITKVLKTPSKTKPSRDNQGKYSPLPSISELAS